MPDSDRRLELVGRPGPGPRESGRVGIGLLVGLAIGHRPVLGAVSGRVALETALGSFVLIVLLGVGSVLFLGYVHDRFADARHDLPDIERLRADASSEKQGVAAGSQSTNSVADESRQAAERAG